MPSDGVEALSGEGQARAPSQGSADNIRRLNLKGEGTIWLLDRGTASHVGAPVSLIGHSTSSARVTSRPPGAEPGRSYGASSASPCRAADAAVVTRLLHDVNTEYSEPTPPPDVLAERILLAAGQTLGGADPCGSPCSASARPCGPRPRCYLAELYVAPDRRGQVLGRALMEPPWTLARAGGLTTWTSAPARTTWLARGLYESLGFSNREASPTARSATTRGRVMRVRRWR